jgi:23S rRNA (guanosine2251-2'-O)-methyltransferase
MPPRKPRAPRSGSQSRPPGGRKASQNARGAGGGKRSPVPRGGGQRGTTPLRGDADTGKRGLGGEQVEGRHAVFELLLAGTRRAREVVLAGDLDPAEIIDDITELAHELKVPVREVSRGKFEAMARTDAPQGVLAMAAPLRSHEIDELAQPGPDGQPAFLLLLDGVTDPGNLGALLRSAECAGVTGVILPRHRAANITPTVTKAAAGAVERLRLSTVPGLPSALARLSDLGVWTVGLDADGRSSLFDLQLAEEPVALVLGAEGAGLSQLVKKRCDTLVSIPLRGRLNSLNVSVAGALACYEVTRRREAARRSGG